jgi:AraC-like DNA-binding protein
VVRAFRHLVASHASKESAVDESMSSSDTDLVGRAQDFLHARYTGRVTLSALAESCRLSPFQMIRAFRRVLGVPPLAYLLQFRVNRAQALLREGSGLAEVAYTCGFADQSHLTRAFKRVVGVPPGQYARSVRRTAA